MPDQRVVTGGTRAVLDPLTSLRFVAALLVFIYHSPIAQPFARAHGLGQAGVGFFFLLSGFILTYTYAHRIDDLRAYAVARFARIYPSYIISIALALVVLTFIGSETWNASDAYTRIIATITQMLAIQAWIPNENIYLGVNSPAWSISVEAFFYAMFPILLRSLLRSFGSAQARTTFMAAALSWACIAAVFIIPHHTYVWTTYIVPPVRLIDFVVGMLLGIAFLRGYRLRGSATVWEVSTIVMVAAAILAIPSVPPGLQYSLWMLPFWGALIAIMALRGGLVSSWLSHPVMVRLGELSFAFYLVHLSVIEVITARIHETAPAVVASIALSLVAAAGLFTFVETPCRRAILDRGRLDRQPGLRRRKAAQTAGVDDHRTIKEIA